MRKVSKKLVQIGQPLCLADEKVDWWPSKKHLGYYLVDRSLKGFRHDYSPFIVKRLTLFLNAENSYSQEWSNLETIDCSKKSIKQINELIERLEKVGFTR